MRLTFNDGQIIDEWDIAANEIVEENAQRPDGLRQAEVSPAGDPFGCGVTRRAFEIGVDAVLQGCTGAEVDQIDLSRAHVDEEVLIFDVAMENLDEGAMSRRDRRSSTYAAFVDVLENLNDLLEEVAGQSLVESLWPFTDEIVQVTAMFGTFENDHELFVVNEIVQHVNHMLDFGHASQEDHFQGQSTVRLETTRSRAEEVHHARALTVLISRIRFFGTTFSATGMPSFFRTPAYTSPKPPDAILWAIKYRARRGSTTAREEKRGSVMVSF